MLKMEWERLEMGLNSGPPTLDARHDLPHLARLLRLFLYEHAQPMWKLAEVGNGRSVSLFPWAGWREHENQKQKWEKRSCWSVPLFLDASIRPYPLPQDNG